MINKNKKLTDFKSDFVHPTTKTNISRALWSDTDPLLSAGGRSVMNSCHSVRFGSVQFSSIMFGFVRSFLRRQARRTSSSVRQWTKKLAADAAELIPPTPSFAASTKLMKILENFSRRSSGLFCRSWSYWSLTASPLGMSIANEFTLSTNASAND